MSPPKMLYTRLGTSGLKISRIILGCMSYGDPKWQSWVLPEDEAIKHIKFAYDHGIQTFDTANSYSNGLSETILGNAIKTLGLPRDELVIMTKVSSPVMAETGIDFYATGKTAEKFGNINQHGLSRKHIFDSVKASLKRLQVDYIDVLQCHRFDYSTPIEETMHALHDVVSSGLVRYIGMSSCYAYQFHQMQNYNIQNGLTAFISLQNHYSLLYREEEREMFPTLKMFGVGATPWSPLARGALARPSNVESTRGGSDRLLAWYQSAASESIVSHVEELAKRKGVSMAQVAIAWMLSKEGVSAPIVGSTSLENLEDIIGALDVKLAPDEIEYLEEPYAPQKVVGHW
ncbi:Aldo/keto reductase [Epithele typhae]|uniref:Aldo/keto reductase n=1 Tax=Epithele typhae TaxID=378194 RepID=UPI002008367C|nr:Aldo/keto reductase [Epithele typhae]KAH9923733.1 Aldo/keto reductase [Epithele typhae]